MSLCDQESNDVVMTYLGFWKYFKAILIEVSLYVLHINVCVKYYMYPLANVPCSETVESPFLN